MKRTLIVFSAILLAATLHAQTPNDVQDFHSHGIHVILRSSKANQVVSAVLGIQGGLAYGETDNPAISGLTAAVLTESGSDKYPKEAYRDSLARLSTTIAGSGDLYHMGFTLQTIRPNFKSAWSIFNDLLLHPHFDTLESSKITEQTIKSIQSRETEPEAYSMFLADSLWWGASKLNHAASVSDVEKVSIPDYRAYRDHQFERSRMLLVVVGNVTRAELESQLAALETLPQGSFGWPKVEHITPVTGTFRFIPKPPEFPTTYLEMRAPSANVLDKDWWAERILYEILDKRLFDEVRTKRNLAYSPEIYANGNFSNFSTRIALQSVLPDSAAHVVFDEIRKTQTTLVPHDELEHSKEGRITTYFFATQKNLRQAQALYSDQVEFGDWRLFFQIVPNTEKVTAAEVKSAAQKYLHGLSFTLMGPEGKSSQGVYKFE
ncbi:MAG: insulinase family protein [Bacteroidota bacterium]|nr:insulinase family protein [Bacteroidota bacterium]MDP4233153.1 insulinase family protein [Bacteroidota bacterium]MDP4241702.1 insulinase family protein [Bacteroidota bacterium]MDP4287360.1 insulinase family protein [Bacteroidota bacterium]